MNLARQSRDVIAGIAREEMGHLATVPPAIYPFDFELERLTKRSLGKYVLAEMPSDDAIEDLKLTKEVAEIWKHAGGGAEPDRRKVHRVGIIYDAIRNLFKAPSNPKSPPEYPSAFIRSEDISEESIRFQVRPQEWGLGYAEMLVETAIVPQVRGKGHNGDCRTGRGVVY